MVSPQRAGQRARDKDAVPWQECAPGVRTSREEEVWGARGGITAAGWLAGSLCCSDVIVAEGKLFIQALPVEEHAAICLAALAGPPTAAARHGCGECQCRAGSTAVLMNVVGVLQQKGVPASCHGTSSR